MQKLFKKIAKRTQRLIENARKGNILDIALFGAGVALIIAIIAVIIVLVSSSIGTSNSESATGSLNAQGSSSLSLSGNASGQTTDSAINPFGQGESSATSQSNAAASSSSASVSSGSSSSSASSSTAVSSSSTAQTTPSSSTSTSTSAPHSHTYTEWVRLAAVCEAGHEERTCTTCTTETDGHRQTRTVLAITEHNWGTQTPLEDDVTGDIIGFSTTCSQCGAIWEEYYEEDDEEP